MADRVCLPGLTLAAHVCSRFSGLLGPGLIAANAGNDAGGIATYSSVGAKYGYDLLWTIVLIAISLAIVQMLAARMGVVTGKGLAELIREEYGIRWSVLATTRGAGREPRHLHLGLRRRRRGPRARSHPGPGDACRSSPSASG